MKIKKFSLNTSTYDFLVDVVSWQNYRRVYSEAGHSNHKLYIIFICIDLLFIVIMGVCCMFILTHFRLLERPTSWTIRMYNKRIYVIVCVFCVPWLVWRSLSAALLFYFSSSSFLIIMSVKC